VPPTLLIAIVLAFVIASAWQSWRAGVQLRARLRDEWGRPRKIQRDMEAIADFFRADTPDDDFIDDRTWNDLMMDDVFSHLDRAESSIGQQLLYHRLRSAASPRSLSAFDALVTVMESDPARRQRIQLSLSHLRSPSIYYLHRLARPGEVGDARRWHILFPVWTCLALVMMSLVFFSPRLLIVTFLCFVANFVIRQLTARRTRGQIAWFRGVGPLLAVAAQMVNIGNKETETITGSLASDLKALKRLGGAMRWLSRDPTTSDPISLAVLELVNVLFLLDTNALYFGGGELRSRAPELLRVIETAGEVDAAIAVASFRAGSRGWMRPCFARPESFAVLRDIRHPLLDQPVPSSIELAPPRGVLITGSNMSGKSTFLRTVGTNVILAQSISTCLASDYQAPVYRVRSCIGRSDDLISGKSYYLVEVESVLSLVEASSKPSPHLFILDELFRGTNAVERIAAAEATLHELIAGGKPHVVLAATHDGELVDLLRGDYSVYHLSDSVSPTGLVFDYQLKPGPATTRNAIALLRLSGASESLVSRALELAATLDRKRQL